MNMLSDTMLQVMMHRRMAYSIHRDDPNVRRLVRNRINVEAVFTGPMISDDEGDDTVVRVPHYRTQLVCISFSCFTSYNVMILILLHRYRTSFDNLTS